MDHTFLIDTAGIVLKLFPKLAWHGIAVVLSRIKHTLTGYFSSYFDMSEPTIVLTTVHRVYEQLHEGVIRSTILHKINRYLDCFDIL